MTHRAPSDTARWFRLVEKQLVSVRNSAARLGRGVIQFWVHEGAQKEGFYVRLEGEKSFAYWGRARDDVDASLSCPRATLRDLLEDRDPNPGTFSYSGNGELLDALMALLDSGSQPAAN